MASKAEKGKALVWFRRDLRTHDHPALSAAAELGLDIIAVYVLDARPGGAAGWWLHASLTRLRDDLQRLNIPLLLRRGSSQTVVPQLTADLGVHTVFANETGFPDDRIADQALHSALEPAGVKLRCFQASTLARPDQLRTKTGTDFKVFTPFWRSLAQQDIRQPLPEIKPRPSANMPNLGGDALEDWNLQPSAPDWASRFPKFWTPGQSGAQTQLSRFLDDRVDGYAEDRDRPDRDGTARISPHLAFGEISPRQVWHATHMRTDGRDATKFLSELAWRDFSYYLLHHKPDLESRNFRPDFDRFPWRDDEAAFKAWCHGETGYPMVDAGMRQLWQTGWMHNRVRMVAASFLVKHLMIDWRRGLDWFADTLVDHDRASNAASWQWVAGCGADAAPYFRIFNPIAQGQKFDPKGDFVRTWCPELAHLPTKYLHAPFQASDSERLRAGIKLGSTYPEPIVDHSTARNRALEAYQSLKQETA